MIRRTAIVAGVFALLLAATAAAETRKLTILHTNDVHARLSPFDSGKGGLAYLATAIRQERAASEASLLLNAGDLVQGTPVSTIFHGLPVFEVANLLGYDAATLGNHDFDYGWMQTRKFIASAKYPIVTDNVVDASGALITGKPYVVLKVNGLRVAIVGAMTDTLKTLSTPNLLQQWHTVPVLEATQRAARQARAEADLVVVVAHITGEEEKALLEGVPDANVIVTGHIHSGMEKEMTSGGRVLVRARGNTEELGRLDLELDTATKTIVRYTWKKIAINKTNLQPAADVAAEVSKWEQEVTKRVDQPLATSARAFDKAGVRALIERAMRESTGADFAFMNGGGVRDTLPTGQLLVRHIWNIMPFDNRVVFGKFKGKQLPKSVVGTRPVDPEREYTLAVSDFTAANQGAKGELETTGLVFSSDGPLLRDVLVDWFRKQKAIQ